MMSVFGLSTSVGLSQLSLLSSLGELLSAQTTALVTASLTLAMSSTSCAGEESQTEKICKIRVSSAYQDNYTD